MRKRRFFKKLLSGMLMASMVFGMAGAGIPIGTRAADNADAYRAVLGNMENGTATLNGEDAVLLAAGEKVVVAAEPEAGYELAAFEVLGESGELLFSRSDLKENEAEFQMPAQDCEVKVEFSEAAGRETKGKESEKSRKKGGREKVTAGDETTSYITGNLKKGKIKEAEEISGEYWEEEAPEDAAEAGRMYLAEAQDKEYSSQTAGAANVEESAELDVLETTAAEKHFDENGLRQTSHGVTVTYTIANDRYLKVDTLKELFDKNIEAFLTAVASTSPVYESRDIDDAYVAFLNYGAMNGLSNKILDAEFVTGEQHSPVDAENDVVFDKKTGIVYIPKSYYFSTDGTEIGYDLQAQVLICPKGEDSSSKIRVTVENKSKAEAVMDEKTLDVSAFDTITVPLATPETAKKISFKDIHVYLNDSATEAPLTEGDLAGFNKETGEYTINQLAANLYSVRFVIDGKSVAERIFNFFKGAEVKAAPLKDGETAGAMMNAVKNVTTGEYIRPSIEYDKLKTKDTFSFDGKNRTHKFELIKDMMDAGVKDFVYGPYLPDSGTDSIRDAFYFAIADDEGSGSKSLTSMIDKLEDKGSAGLVQASGQNPDAGATSSVNTSHSRFYWYMFLIGAPSGTLKEVNSGKEVSFGKASEWKWSDDYSYEGEKTYQNMYPAMCCHIGDDILDSKKKNQVSVLEKKDGYVVLGLVQSDEGSSKDSQAGATIIKVYAKDNKKLSLQKVSKNPSITTDNRCYSLEGAKYGVYTDSDCTQQVGTLITDENGHTPQIELPTGTYYVREIDPPMGYIKNDEVYGPIELEKEETLVEVEDIPGNDPLDINVYKIDKETGKRAQGAASLEGAEFTINYYDGLDYTLSNLPNKPKRSWILQTKPIKLSDGTIHYMASLDDDFKISGDAFYYDNNQVVLPLGTITVEETKPPKGYKLTGAFLSPEGSAEKYFGKYITHIKDSDSGVFLEGGNEFKANDSVIRGELSFRKKDEETQETMAGIPFRLTSDTTKESHVVVTDENGQFSTLSSVNRHSIKTNANDGAADGDGEVDEARLDPEAGTWFGINADGNLVEVDDEAGALPYDTYTLEELRCSMNKGKALYKGKVTVSKDYKETRFVVDLGDIENADLTVSTSAKNEATGTHYANAEEDTTIIDTVAYTGLRKGASYKLAGTLMDKETGRAVLDKDGNPVTAEKPFVPKTAEGSVEVEFCFDASALKGKDTVVFEELYLVTEKDGEPSEEKKAEHKDLEDGGQTIHFPEIGTKAEDKDTETNVTKASEDIEITDTVEFKNLKPDKEYTLKGMLMDRETGKAALDDNGNPVTATVKFRPETAEGVTDVTFRFSGVKLAGKTLVAFEELEYKGKTLAVHADIEDEGQTIHVPGVETEAKDAGNKTHTTLAGEKTTVEDTVRYTNLFPGKEYRVSGTLMDKKTGKPLLADGKEVTSETTFVPEEPDGEVKLTFTFNSSALAGKTVVAFETLYYEGKEVGVHADIEDEGQSVHIPKVGTTATDKEDGSHKVTAKGKVTVTDEVRYENLTPGRKYKVTGVLMDKKTGKALLADGREVTAEKTFTAVESSGTVSVDFTFDAKELAGKELVAFEKLYDVEAKAEIANHEEIKDKAQTVEVVKEKRPSTPGRGTGGNTGGGSGLIRKVQTGDSMAMFVLAVMGILLGGAGTAAVRKKRR